MSRKFISSVIIAAVTVTGISLAAAPARASEDDLAKLLFGATALIIIGKAIHDRNDRSDRDTPDRVVVHPQPRPRPHRSRKALPASCLRVHDTWDGRVRMLSKRCLERRYDHVDRLPQSCRTRIRTDDGPRRGYRMRCLRHNGYYLASR